MNLVLCSQSPRRIKILKDLGFEFEFFPPNINEDEIHNEDPFQYLRRISSSKIDFIISKRKNLYYTHELSKTDDSIYISSDTIVVFQNKILHKTSDETEAIQTLTSLNGNSHFVHSSICIKSNNNLFFDYDTTEVQFKLWTLHEIKKYLKDYKPFDKAGCYGIQDQEGPVLKFIGSYSNVLGFPMRKFFQYSEIWKQSLLQ
jgi:septum formation protein